ncbi:maleylpyruvate isomerase family mycothiol-dependent enzyme [Streptomyces zagrosensis]|uniref:Maleylpyruvate isomerase n=1 Tax=Streptomyces zagrosensis TaxID=1042984 RepID=A0A7W9UW77_9ACTN|nr:maleylpyruvate isomerase family mycothiol-dependent enzyme [Streptomyces zagrosensis]MBB5933600.1 maleylpyruvate isomerase [Streptomyces zagrosensis]
MTDFAHDAAAVQAATDRLLTAVTSLDDAAATRPSLLPGWTRGHILAHLARNADAIVNLLTWARTGEETPMYANDDARNADIARDADRPLPVHLDDLRTSAFRFNSAAAALTHDRWEFVVAMRNGVTERAARLPFRRLIEVELHHVDLDIGYQLTDLPDDFVEREVEFLTSGKFAGHADVPALTLTTPAGRAWHTGRSEGKPITIEGTPVALLGWLTGRADGSELVSPVAPLPTLPPLG